LSEYGSHQAQPGPDNFAPLVFPGADAIAVVSDIVVADEPDAAPKRLIRLDG
jgi:thiamine monophosphate synthase